jgi:hypothetical protein
VTKHQGEHENRTRRCCCRGPKRHAKTSAGVTNEVNHAPLDYNKEELPKTTLADYERHLSVWTQTIALLRFYMKRNWTGRPSIINWVIYSVFCIGNTVMGFSLVVMWPDVTMYYMLVSTGKSLAILFVWFMSKSSSYHTYRCLYIKVFLLSMILVSIISPIYGDRHLGLHLMMQTQSMLDKSFLLGTSLYATVVALGYTTYILTFLFATKIYR